MPLSFLLLLLFSFVGMRSESNYNRIMCLGGVVKDDSGADCGLLTGRTFGVVSNAEKRTNCFV